MPLDAPVLMECAEGGASDIARPRLRRAFLNQCEFDEAGGPHRFDEDGPVQVVHLAPGATEQLVTGDLATGEQETFSY
ncbi:MAG: hypothetical protein ACREH4_12305 [Vitreimonas sp.]